MLGVASTIVVEPPLRVVTAIEARAARVFSADDEAAYIENLLEVAQSLIDGPDGTLNRCIGEQVLQITLPDYVDVRGDCLPYPPFVEIVSNVLSDDGCTRIVKWKAGQEVAKVPKRIKLAIIMMAGKLRDAVPDEGGAIKRETVDGIGSTDYSLPNGAADAMTSAAAWLLAPYRVYA